MSQPSFTARKTANVAQITTSCLVVPIFKGLKLKGDIAKLDTQMSGAITRAIELGDFTAEVGSYI